MIKVSIVIPTYNRARSLERTLDSVLQLDFPRLELEVVVVDNNSSDDTPGVVESFRKSGVQTKYILEKRLSFTLARHSGAAASSGRILAYIDDDVIVDRYWLGAVVQAFEADEKVGVVGGPILPSFETKPPSWLEKFYPMTHWLSLMDLGSELCETQYAQGPNFSVRRDILDLVGGFPPDTIGIESENRPGVVEKIYVGSGDGGLCDRVRSAQYKVVYAPRALVHHVIPPVRLTKAWWRSRFAGEACFHALNDQYYQNNSRIELFGKMILAIRKVAAFTTRYMWAFLTNSGKERHEFWISYYLRKARVELSLLRHPRLAQELSEVALTGVSPERVERLSDLIP